MGCTEEARKTPESNLQNALPELLPSITGTTTVWSDETKTNILAKHTISMFGGGKSDYEKSTHIPSKLGWCIIDALELFCSQWSKASHENL